MSRRKTNEEFIKEVFELVGDEYIFLDKYNGSTNYLRIKHNIDSCNHVYEVQPKYFLKGQRCPICSHSHSRKRNRTHEEFINEIIEIRGDIYDFLSEYKSSLEPVKIKHKECGYEWDVTPSNLAKKNQKGKVYCPNCNGGIKVFNTESYRIFIKGLLGEDYEVLGEYVNYQTPIKMRHTFCNHIYYPRPNDIIYDNNKCPKCAGNIKKTTEQFKKEVFDIFGNEYVVMSEYVNSNTDIIIKHNVEYCNHIYQVTPRNLIHDQNKCPKCYKENIFIHKENFQERLTEKYGNEYIILSDYVNYNTKVKFKHNTRNCQRVFFRRPYHILINDIACDCTFKKSNGEYVISNFLSKNNINFIPQYKFNDCKYKKKLPFDFGILNEVNELLFLIEFDGEGHFEPFRFSKNKDKNLKKLFDTQRNDKIKNEYCRDNNIPLYRIPYWKFDEIEYILKRLIHNEHIEVDLTSFLIV